MRTRSDLRAAARFLCGLLVSVQALWLAGCGGAPERRQKPVGPTTPTIGRRPGRRMPPVFWATPVPDPAKPFTPAADHPVSTFPLDVDNASYAEVRDSIVWGQPPPADAVRIEEMLNYFVYDYPPPVGGAPLALHVESARCPWNPTHGLVRVAVQGKTVPPTDRPPANIVLLMDCSGQMSCRSKLPLARSAAKLLVNHLAAKDRVSVVAYRGAGRPVLNAAPGAWKVMVNRALDSLRAGGETSGRGGIELAYEVAASNFIRGGVNRVILCTDGGLGLSVEYREDLLRLAHLRARGPQDS